MYRLDVWIRVLFALRISIRSTGTWVVSYLAMPSMGTCYTPSTGIFSLSGISDKLTILYVNRYLYRRREFEIKK